MYGRPFFYFATFVYQNGFSKKIDNAMPAKLRDVSQQLYSYASFIRLHTMLHLKYYICDIIFIRNQYFRMSINKKIAGTLFLTFCMVARVAAQNNDSIINRLSHYVSIINHFSKNLPQEKVYLHFDNSTYYQGDDIWFNCYLVTSGFHQASKLSKTLYVELLNPGGEVIDKQILKIENSQCHGNFSLNKLPFYSGFYEVRAYTKYMLNFGEDVIFSRTFPVYDKPTKPGAYAEKSLLKYGWGKYPIFREKPEKQKKVTLKLFPEGGNLVKGVPSQVAFEATDAYGNPIEISSGAVLNENQDTIVRFKSVHDGRGVFSYTPGDKIQSGDKEPKIVIDYKVNWSVFTTPTKKQITLQNNSA
jgi:hypothetical protein